MSLTMIIFGRNVKHIIEDQVAKQPTVSHLLTVTAILLIIIIIINRHFRTPN